MSIRVGDYCVVKYNGAHGSSLKIGEVVRVTATSDVNWFLCVSIDPSTNQLGTEWYLYDHDVKVIGKRDLNPIIKLILNID